jgi:hypothetical protein
MSRGKVDILFWIPNWQQKPMFFAAFLSLFEDFQYFVQ